MSSEIRTFDFGEAEWFDAMGDTNVRLSGGLAHRDEDPAAAPGGVSWRVLGPPAYTDLDGDGDEDAAVGLHATGGQMFNSAWHLWLWQDGTAMQVRRPIARATRCDGLIESVTAKAGAFAVSLVLKEGDDPCATSGSVPITYDVGIRDGWPVRVGPEYGPVETCNPHDHGFVATPPGAVQLRTSPDDQAPPIGEPIRPLDVLLDDLYDSTYLENKPEWVLVIAVLRADQTPREVCGWARYREVVGG